MAANAPPSPSPAAARAAASTSASATPPVAGGSANKRAADLTLNSDSEDDDDGLTELERLRARVVELERRDNVKQESGVKSETGEGSGQRGRDEKPSVKRVKREGEGSSGGSAKKGKGKMEVIVLD